MGNFNRDNRSGRGGDIRRGGFGGRSFDRPEMHEATCDSCGKRCEVPFRPTSGKPVYCSDCFRNQGGSDSRRSQDRNYERPSYEPKRTFNDNNQSQYNEQFQALNSKLDRILRLLDTTREVAPEQTTEAAVIEEPRDTVPTVEKKTKTRAKKASLPA